MARRASSNGSSWTIAILTWIASRDQRLQPAERVTFLVARSVPLAALELGEKVRARDQCMLDDLGHPGGELTVTERLQRRHIRDDRATAA